MCPIVHILGTLYTKIGDANQSASKEEETWRIQTVEYPHRRNLMDR